MTVTPAAGTGERVSDRAAGRDRGEGKGKGHGMVVVEVGAGGGIIPLSRVIRWIIAVHVCREVVWVWVRVWVMRVLMGICCHKCHNI